MKSEKTRALIVKGAVVLSGILIYTMALPSTSFAGTQWNVGISGGNNRIDGFHLSVGEYYQVPEREVVVIHKRSICDDDLPVVFFLAQRARVHPDAITRLRLRGMSWLDITLHFGLKPDIYYYGNNHHHDWRRHGLRDHDVREWVNTRFISEHYRYAPDRIHKYRSQGRSFRVIDHDIRNERHGKIAHQKGKPPIYKRESWNNHKDNDRNKGKGRDERRENGRGR